jgi:hypothetical protein
VKGTLLALIFDSPIANVILGNVIHKVKELDKPEKMEDCVAVQTRSQVRPEVEGVKRKYLVQGLPT